jgi:hypothetical protein
MVELSEHKSDKLLNKSKKRTAIILTVIILIFYLFAVFIVVNVLDTDNLRHKLIHIDSKIVGSRWVYYE